MFSTLPRFMEEHTVTKMKNGERGYTAPWAMSVDTQRRLWIDPTYPVYDRPRGTCHMLIKKKGDVILVGLCSVMEEKYRLEANAGGIPAKLVPLLL